MCTLNLHNTPEVLSAIVGGYHRLRITYQRIHTIYRRSSTIYQRFHTTYQRFMTFRLVKHTKKRASNAGSFQHYLMTPSSLPTFS